jgi:hypothetical protein
VEDEVPAVGADVPATPPLGDVLAPAWLLPAAPPVLGVPPVLGDSPDEPSLQPWSAVTSTAAPSPMRWSALT